MLRPGTFDSYWVTEPRAGRPAGSRAPTTIPPQRPRGPAARARRPVQGVEAVLLLDVLYRAGLRSDADRDDEDRARDFFDDHGYWPDEKRSP